MRPLILARLAFWSFVTAGSAFAQQPTPELQALDDQLPGTLINDPSQMDLQIYGAGSKTKQVRDASIPGGGAALQIDIAAVGSTPYAIGGNAPLRTAIRAGSDYTVGFYARVKSVDTPDGKGRLGIRFQQNAAPYPGFGDKLLLIDREWTYHEVTAKADRDIPAGQAVISFQLAGAKQQIEIGQIIVVEGATSIKVASSAEVAEPEIPPQIAAKGVLLNDPKKRDWQAYGAGVKAEPTTTNVFGRIGTKLTVAAPTTQPYDAGASLNIGANISANDIVLVAFLARSLSASTADGNAVINLRMQKGVPPYEGFGDRQIKLTPNWRLYQFRVQPEADLNADQAQIAVHLGMAAQQFEIGPVYIVQEIAQTN